VQRYIFEEELGYVGSPPLIPFGPTMCGPVLLRFARTRKKRSFFPGFMTAKISGARATPSPARERPGVPEDQSSQRKSFYVVNGQKIWTTPRPLRPTDLLPGAHRPGAEKRQEGISFLLIDRRRWDHGAAAHPDGRRSRGDEVFFDDVRLPLENLVHEEGKGWTVAKYTARPRAHRTPAASAARSASSRSSRNFPSIEKRM